MGPQIFSLRGLPSLYFTAKFHAPATKTGVLEGGASFYFFKATYNTRSDSGHALGPIIVFISSYRGRNLLKKFEDRVLNFFPVLEIWPPKLYQFFGKFLPKIHVGLV